MPLTVYWDACVFHALLGEEDGRLEICKAIEQRAKEGSLLRPESIKAGDVILSANLE